MTANLLGIKTPMARHFAALNNRSIVLCVLLGSEEYGSGDVSFFERNVLSIQDVDERGRPIFIGVDDRGQPIPAMVKPTKWIEAHNPMDTPIPAELLKDARVVFRKNYPGLGHKFDDLRDGFVSPKPLDIRGRVAESWTLNELELRYDAPISKPVEQGKFFGWEEPDPLKGEVVGKWVVTGGIPTAETPAEVDI